MIINKLIIVLIPFVFFIIGCSDSSVSDGGSVSDVGNPFVSGIVSDSLGNPIKDVVIEIYPADYNPISDTLLDFPLLGLSDSLGKFKINVADTQTKYSLLVTSEKVNSAVINSGIFGTVDTTIQHEFSLKGLSAVKIYFKDSAGLAGNYLYIAGSDIFMFIEESDIILKNDRYFILFDSLPKGQVGELVLFNGTLDLGVSDNLKISDTLDVHMNYKWSFYDYTNSSLPDDTISEFLIENTGALWVGTSKNGLFKFENGIFSQIEGSQGLSITSIAENKNSELIIGTYTGLYKYSNTVFTQYSVASLPDSHITDITVDSRGIEWIGTPKGCVKVDNSFIEVLDTGSTPLKESYITSISEEVDSVVVICTKTGFGIYKNDSWTVYYIGDINCEIKDTIRGVAVNQAGKKYFATKSGIVVLSGSFWYSYETENEGIFNNDIRSIGIDEDNNVWAGTNSPATIYDVGTSYAFYHDLKTISFLKEFTSIRSIETAGDSLVYFGTAGNGLVILDIFK